MSHCLKNLYTWWGIEAQPLKLIRITNWKYILKALISIRNYWRYKSFRGKFVLFLFNCSRSIWLRMSWCWFWSVEPVKAATSKFLFSMRGHWKHRYHGLHQSVPLKCLHFNRISQLEPRMWNLKLSTSFLK